MKRVAFFDKHHQMERFCALFLATILVLAGCWIDGVYIKGQKDKLQISEKGLYSVSQTWSLTNTKVSNISLYRNNDFTKTFLLLKFSSASDNGNAIYELSPDVNDYSLYMTAQQGTSVEGNPKASVYLFADTGYVGVLMLNSLGFNSALYDITMRCPAAVMGDVDASDSFKKFNQIRVMANLAGTSVPVAEFLNKENPSSSEIYSEIMLKSDVAQSSQDITQAIIDMGKEMKNINQLSDTLKSQGMTVPELPYQLAGDYITLDESLTVDNPTAFNSDMLDMSGDVDTFDVTINIDSQTAVDKYKAENSVYLVTDYVFPGGYQYNHQNLSLTDSIIDKLVDESGMGTYETLNEYKTEEKSEYDSDLVFDEWYDNMNVRFICDTTNSRDVMIQNTIDKYENAVEHLYELKRNYQCNLLKSYLDYENQAAKSVNMFTVRSDSVNSEGKTIKVLNVY